MKQDYTLTNSLLLFLLLFRAEPKLQLQLNCIPNSKYNCHSYRVSFRNVYILSKLSFKNELQYLEKGDNNISQKLIGNLFWNKVVIISIMERWKYRDFLLSHSLVSYIIYSN